MEYPGVEPQSLVLFGQGGGELYMGEEGEGGGSAEERIRTLLGDGSDRGLARRRIRRPLGGGYQSQGLVFSDGERDSGQDPLSELLAHLTASRSGNSAMRSREAAESVATPSGLSQALVEEAARPSFARSLAEETPERGLRLAQRTRFMQELSLSHHCEYDGAFESGQNWADAKGARPPGQRLRPVVGRADARLRRDGCRLTFLLSYLFACLLAYLLPACLLTLLTRLPTSAKA